MNSLFPSSTWIATRLFAPILGAFAMVSMAAAQTKGVTLALTSMEVDIAVGAQDSEVTASLHFTTRYAAKHRKVYELFIPVYVPDTNAGRSAASRKYKPALSVERRPVIVRKATPPAAIARINTIPGMKVVWWRALLSWPRRGEALIVDMRYLQKTAVVGRVQSCIYVPIVPDGPLSEDSRAVIHTDLPGIALNLRSGKLKKKGLFSKWLGKGKSKGKSLECALQHKLPIIVDLVSG